MGIFHRKNRAVIEYDRMNEVPVIHASICTGEEVAGLKDLRNGHFREIMLIRGDDDLQVFAQSVGLRADEIRKEY